MCVLSQKARDGKSSRPFTHFLKEVFTSISLLGDTCRYLASSNGLWSLKKLFEGHKCRAEDPPQSRAS